MNTKDLASSTSPRRGGTMNQKTMPSFGRKQSGTNQRMDFLVNGRKPSSQAFPLLGGESNLSKDEMYDFENKLRDVIAELNKPIYDKIQDMLTQQRTIKGSQDEVNRKTKEIEFELQTFSQYGVKMDDLKTRIDDNETNIQQIYVSSQRKISTVQDEFQKITTDFRREEEYSRVARKAADNLQQEYCKIVHSVASEKQRNLMYIEKAKREFVSEVTNMSMKVAEIDKLQYKLTTMEEMFESRQKDLILEFETKLFEQKSGYDRKLAEIKLDGDRNDETIKNLQHQLKLQGLESARIEREVQNTDFFLNKVQPISGFTQLVTMMRAIIDDEEQLDRIQNLQTQFFKEISPDQKQIEEHLKVTYMKKTDTLQSSQLEKVSPHYERLSAAMKEVENLKLLAKEEAPSILLGDELTKFEGLLKKVQNHRDIVKTYEMAIDEFQSNSNEGSDVDSGTVDQKNEDDQQEQIIYVQGRRTTIMAAQFPKNSSDQGQNVARKDLNSQRRSQSELNGVLQANQGLIAAAGSQSNALAQKKLSVNSVKNPLHLNLSQANKTNQNTDEGKQRTSGRSPARSQRSMKKTNRSSRSKRQPKLSRRDQDQLSSHDSYENSDQVASQLSQKKIKELQQYEMTREKWEASEQALNVFERQFSIRAQVCDKVTAFKKGLMNIYDLASQRRQTAIGTTIQSKFKGISVVPLDKQQTQVQTERKKKDISRHASSNSVRSFKGKLIDSPQANETNYAQKTNVLNASQESKQFTKDEILVSFIGQQLKINDYHGVLVKNILEDKAQQFEEDQDQSDSDSDDNSKSSTSSLQDEMEALDSVHIDDIGSQIGIAKTNLDVTTPHKVNSADTFGDSAALADATNQSIGKNNTAGRRSKLSSQHSEQRRSKRSHGSSKHRLESMGMNSKKPTKSFYRQGSRISSALQSQSQSRTGGGSSKKSKKFGAKSIRAGGGGGGAKMMEKHIMILRKELEKKMKKKFEESKESLSTEQSTQVASMIQKQSQKTENDYMPKFVKLFADAKELKADLEDEFKQMKELICMTENLSKEFKQLNVAFIEQKERYNVSIKRMIKDKRSIVQLMEDQGKKVERNQRVNAVHHSYMADISRCVNALIDAEEIELSLYRQDEVDREQVVLYGINEEAGKVEMQAKSPIQVNNNCLQCSGNASFIKKAFKIACLTYMPSKVKHRNQEYTRSDLFDERKSMVTAQQKLSVDRLNQAVSQEEARLVYMLEQQNMKCHSDLSMQHLQESYGDPNKMSPLNRAVDSMTTFNHDPKMMSFRDINSSTIKLETGEMAKPVTQVDAIIKTTVASKISRHASPLSNLKLATIGHSEQKQPQKASTMPQYHARGMSATLAKKSVITLSDIDGNQTLPIVTPVKPETSKLNIESPTTFQKRKSSISGSIKLGNSETAELARRNFYAKAVSQTEVPTKNNIDVKSQPTTGRKLNQASNPNGVLSGRVLNTGRGAFSTIDTAAKSTQRKSQVDSQNYPRGSINNLFGSPTNTLAPKKLDMSSGELGINKTQPSHMRRRTILGASQQKKM